MSAGHHNSLSDRLATSCDVVWQETRAAVARQPLLTVAVCRSAWEPSLCLMTQQPRNQRRAASPDTQPEGMQRLGASRQTRRATNPVERRARHAYPECDVKCSKQGGKKYKVFFACAAGPIPKTQRLASGRSYTLNIAISQHLHLTLIQPRGAHLQIDALRRVELRLEVEC